MKIHLHQPLSSIGEIAESVPGSAVGSVNADVEEVAVGGADDVRNQILREVPRTARELLPAPPLWILSGFP